MIWLIILWVIATAAVASAAVLIGKRYGVEYTIAAGAALVVIANVLANKIIVVGPFTAPAGVIVFSTTFLITDLLSELWGSKYAKKAVWAGFFGNLLLVLSVYIAVNWQPAPFAVEMSDMFSQVLGLTPRIVVGSLIAYLLSQHHDIWAYHFWKKVTKGRHLWLRNNASTITSQLIDSIVFITIGFYGVFPIVPLIFGQWAVKIMIALIDTPFMYIITRFAKRL